MSRFNYKSTVGSTEAAALKEMIFKRARERAESLDNEVKASYSDDVQNDVMNIARDSFVTTKNPFSMIAEGNKKPEPTPKAKEDTGLGFPQRKIDEIKSNIVYRNKEISENTSRKAVESTMDDARADFKKKDTFIGALNFLNSQASIALIKTSGKSFDAIA